MRFTKKELIELIENEVPDGPIELISEEKGFTEDRDLIRNELWESFLSTRNGTYNFSIEISWKGKFL